MEGGVAGPGGLGRHCRDLSRTVLSGRGQRPGAGEVVRDRRAVAQLGHGHSGAAHRLHPGH